MSGVFPQFTTVARDDLGTDLTAGLIIWNTTTTTHQTWDGAAWVDIGIDSDGTTANTFTINTDAVAATDENACLIMQAGDGVNLNAARICQTHVGGIPVISVDQLVDGLRSDIQISSRDPVVGSVGEAFVLTGTATADADAGTGAALAGRLILNGGAGGVASAAQAAGPGGPLQLNGGEGGDGSAGVVSGAGGDVDITGGPAGATGGAGEGAPGNVNISGGDGTTNGTVFIQPSIEGGIEVGIENIALMVIGADVSVAAEAGNAVAIALQFTDMHGTDLPENVVFNVSLFDDSGWTTASNPAAQNLTVTADGAAQDGSGTELMTAISDATGACTISVVDATAALVGSRYVIIQPVSSPGSGNAILGVTQIATAVFT